MESFYLMEHASIAYCVKLKCVYRFLEPVCFMNFPLIMEVYLTPRLDFAIQYRGKHRFMIESND